jgi:hypothetical protein
MSLSHSRSSIQKPTTDEALEHETGFDPALPTLAM